MLKIDKQSIYLTRGDTAEISVTANLDTGDPYTFATGDVVIFRMGLKPGRDVALEKQCTVDVEENKAVLYLNPEDTAHMEFKVYRYEFELICAEDGGHYTFIVDQPFEVGKEIERYE